jgi:hypothetical protein
MNTAGELKASHLLSSGFGRETEWRLKRGKSIGYIRLYWSSNTALAVVLSTGLSGD